MTESTLISLDAAWQQAISHHQAGRLTEAEQLYRAILQAHPNHPDANHNLGVLAVQCKNTRGSIPFFKTATEAKPSVPQYWISYVNALIDSGLFPLANTALTCAKQNGLPKKDVKTLAKQIKAGMRTVEQSSAAEQSRPNEHNTARSGQPQSPSAQEINSLVKQLNMGHYSEAATYAKILTIRFPHHGFGWKVLGVAFIQMGRSADALLPMQKAAELSPDDAEAQYNLGIFLFEQFNRYTDAEASYRRAIQINSEFANAHYNLGNALVEQDRPIEAESSYREALRINPDFALAHYNLGIVLQAQGHLEEAEDCYDRAQKLGLPSARIRAALMLPSIMGTNQQVAESRAAFERKLDQLIADNLSLDDPLKNGWHSNFYLAYHGLNDRDLQVKVAKFYASACPSLLFVSPHCAQHNPRTNRKIRVGFFSKYLYNHSVSLCFSKIIVALSLENDFDVTLISNHPIDTQIYSGFSGKSLCVPENLQSAQNSIASIALDVLIYLDVGMEPFSYFLAFSRLAPVQCVLGGHPVTSGIPTLDYYLSTHSLEPANAQEHYSETLVLLPSAIFHFERPALPERLKSRSEMGLPENQNIYLCPMKLQKLHPDFDLAVARILQSDPNGTVVFFEDHQFPSWKTALVQRFEKTIPSNLHERILFLPWISNYSDFLCINTLANVIIDPFHFGIGSTIIAAFAVGTPIVTCPSAFCRGRVGMFFCNMINLNECVAENINEFVNIAVHIASNPTLQQNIRTKILANNHQLFDHFQQPLNDLAQFIRKPIKITA